MTNHHRTHGHARRAFTLIEMIVACAITMILAIGLGSVVMLASRAMPRAKATTEEQISENASRALGQVAADVSQAVASPVIKPGSMLLELPDRDGDGDTEAVQYVWGGSKGDPLTRGLNLDDPVNVIDSVKTFVISPVVEQRSSTSSGTPVVNSSSLLAGYTGTANVWADAKSSSWPATAFTVTLPEGATTYTITKVELYVSRTGLLVGADHIELRSTWPDGTPTNTILARANLPGGILALAAGWQTYSLTYLGSDRLTSRMLALVVAHDSGSDVLSVATTNSTVAGIRSGRSTDSGATFTMGDGSMAFRANGVAYIAQPVTTTRNVVRCVDLSIQCAGMAAPLQASVRTPAEPTTN